MQSGGFVSVRLGSAQCRVPVQRGISASAFTDLCRRAFPHFPAHSVVAALRDSDAKYEFNLVSQYPDEFADGAVYALVLGPANDTMADNDVNMGNEDGSPYVLYFENEDLGLTAPDVRLLKALVVRTHLRHTEFEDAVDIFRVATSGTPGLVPQRGFEAALRELIPADRVRNLAMGSMTRLFALTDRVRSGACDFGELVSAFSLFCAGSKSDKLSLAFRLLDTNQDGRITRRQLWRFLRSFLTVLFSLSVASLNEGVETLYTIIDDATVSIAQTVFAELADAGDGPRKSISFEEFGEWYNQGGFRMVPWLELLDLGKWPFAEVDELDDEEDEPAADAAKGAAASGEEPLLQFPLCAEDGLYLVLSPADVEAYNDLLTNTQLYLVEPFTIVNEFLVHEKQGTLSRADFEKVVRELCPVKPLSGKVQEALTKIFDAFEINDSNKVDMSSFLAGFLMLASGSKSDKLLLAFRLFDDDTDGQLNRRQMWTFLRSYLTILVAVSSCYDMPRASLNFLIDSGAIDACASVFSAEREQGGDEDKISFQEFGAWYNRGGFERVPWLELLDFAKWPSVGGSSEYSSSAAGSQASSAGDEADATGDDDEDDDDLIFRFELDPKQPGTLLEVNTADVATVRRIVDAANLSEVRPSSIVELFEAAAGPSNVLTKPKFNSVVRRLIPGDNLSSDDKEFLSFALSNIFYAFDRNNDGTVDFDEFAAGFAMLASGSKSEKLQLAFRMFDVDGDGYISTLEMWRYLRSFLTVLLALNGAAQQLPTDRLVDLIDSAAVSITQQVFKTADVNRDNRISYAEFGNWYNDKQGYTMLPWLELLDMNKWPAPATSADAESDGSTEACFEFVLTADGHLLRIMPEDVRAFQRVTQSSTLDEVDVATLQRVFDEVAGDAPALTKAAFNRAVRALIPGQALSEDEQRFLSYMLSNLFFAFDADHNGAVDREEFTAGFLLLCSGNKSDKLSLAFRLFDTNSDGYLDREEMSRYLRAFLTSLAAMTALASDPQTPDIVDSSAAALADHIFETADLNRDNVISYEEFGTWYNEGGYRVLPWLELLDLKKWPEVPAEGDEGEDDDGADATADDDDEPDLEAGRGAGAPTEEDDDEYSDDFESDEGSDDSEADGLVFEFDLTADEKLAITTGDCLRLVEITEASQLCTIMPAVVHETFLGEAHDAAITKAAFDAAVRKLVPGDSLTEEEKAFLTITLSNFYFAFDRDQQGYVDCDELAAGFTLFCAGNKSDKLSLAFLLFNDGDSGSLSQPELWRFLRSFLVALAAASHCRAPLEPEMVSEVLDQHAADMTARIFEESRAGRADPSTISYEELGTWYNEGGYAVLPWLELLDLSKWPEVDGSDDEGDDDEGDDNAASAANAADGEEDGDDDDDEDGYDDSDPLYQFLLSFKSQVMLEITALNVDTLAKVLVLSRLHNTDVQTLYTVLAEGSDEDGRITKSAFNRCMRSLIPGDGLDKDEQNFLSIVLSSIFFVFASGDDPYVDFVEFAAGFSLLVGGSKSDKLSQALRLFNMHGKLHERQLAAFLRAFLLALASVSTFVIRRTVDEVRELLTATSAELAELIFAESADDREESNTITYEEFGEWYNQGGYEVLPWLELLDLQKWPQASVEGEDDDEDDEEGDEQAATNGERHVGFNVEDDDDEDEDDDDDEDEDDDDDDDDEDDDGEDEQVMFAFPLSPAAADQAEDSDLLLITASDCRSLHALVTRSGLPTVSCDEVFAAFKSRASDSGTIDKEGFDSAVRSLVPSTSLSDEEKQFLSFALSRMFYAFASAADSVGKVQAVDLATGMTMLAGGNKSNKLLLAFNTYSSRGDAEDDTSVDASGLAGMLKCFLTMLLAVNSFNSDTTDVEPSSLKAASQRCATEIFKRIEPSGDTISYEDFGLWYNSGGFDVLPWLELLDVKKWPTGVLSSSDDDSYGAEENSEGSGDESELTDDENLADPAPGDGDNDGDDDGDDKGASSPARSRRLSFSRAIPAMVKARRTMSSINVQAMHAEFLAEANEDGVLDRDGFAAVVERIIPMEAIPAPEDRVFVKFTLDNVFSTFDRDGDGFVDYDEFCAGMGMLAGDSRSQKVQLAFSLMDEDGDGSITRHELWKTLRSFLTTLAAMDPGKHKLDMKQRRKLHVAIDRRAKEAMEAVFRDADTNHDEMITYDEWEAWYSVHGAAELPWVHALEHAAAAVTAPTSPQRNRTRSEEDMGIELTPLAHEEHKAGGAFDDDFQIAVTAHGYDDIAVTGADLSHASALRATTGLGSVPVEQLRQTLAEAAGADNRLTLAAFSKAMKQFAPAGASSTAAADAGAKTLTALFTAFDVHSAGVASLGDVVTGLSVLCTGGLNDRVQALVAVYDLDEDNKISRRETFSMIQALATVLVALRVLRRNETFDRAVRQQVFKFAANVNEVAFKEADTDKDGMLSLDELRAWMSAQVNSDDEGSVWLRTLMQL